MSRKLIYTSILLASCSFVVDAQNKINLNGLNKLNELKAEVKSRSVAAEMPVIEVLATMNQGWDAGVLAQFGGELVLEVDSEIIVVALPVDRVEEFANSDEVFYVEFGNEYRMTMDFARPASNVSQLQDGFEYDGVTMSFTGKGVVTGLMDQGIDPNNVNFNDADGVTRVKEVYDFDRNIACTDARKVRTFTTDRAAESHGTHVAGIMAGSYKGEGQYTTMTSPSTGFSSPLTTGNIPYYGVATGSDIVMASGTFSETNIVKGVAAAVDYAKANSMPVVVNLSLGSNDGPHDGSSTLSRSLANYGKSGIICISSGNEGDSKMFVGKKFTSDDKVLKTCLQDNRSSGFDIWTNGSSPVKVTLALCSATGRLTELASLSAVGSANLSTNATFTTSFSGSCSMMAEVNRLNNRYHVQVSGTFTPKTTNSLNSFAVVIEGSAGQQVYVYGYGDKYTSFTDKNFLGFTDGTTDGTINGTACGSNVLAIGSYNSRIAWPNLNAIVYSFTDTSFKVGEVSPFSSFGDTYQGVSLPTICAPGAGIISSYSRYYTNAMSETQRRTNMTAKASSGTMDCYWGEMQGTSMSCPYVAGVIALWLEADPTLDVATVDEILRSTAVAPTTASALLRKQWGGGKLDALAGIKEVLRRKAGSGIGNVVADGTGYVITPEGRGVYNVIVDGAGSLRATLYNMQGIAVAETSAAGSELTLDAASAQPGVYILTVDTPNTDRITRRVLIK